MLPCVSLCLETYVFLSSSHRCESHKKTILHLQNNQSCLLCVCVCVEQQLYKKEKNNEMNERSSRDVSE